MLLQFPGLGLPFKLLIVSGVIFSSLMNTVSAFNIILTQGVGKNGATVAVSRCYLSFWCVNCILC